MERRRQSTDVIFPKPFPGWARLYKRVMFGKLSNICYVEGKNSKYKIFLSIAPAYTWWLVDNYRELLSEEIDKSFFILEEIDNSWYFFHTINYTTLRLWRYTQSQFPKWAVEIKGNYHGYKKV